MVHLHMCLSFFLLIRLCFEVLYLITYISAAQCARCKEIRNDLLKEKPEMRNAQLTALISMKWKELSEEEKRRWNGEAVEPWKLIKWNFFQLLSS
ncbi:hypothetical protein QVD17_18238 [Tagetes erecta]|uniref:HMG box domain-containing protein n=1 Tax=Tagetes erecta TaxID=13708 RepID=A0AAD8KK36_TARER|nr:hypothetical protein QVD17_18238 [Tagetes erecta]